ncbi:hypothetical protein CCHR01_15328 [Colletotrichum chrysophilum]|uniref:Uncharacterized protein n=1 Tax=Colletotrichum chrysophilum TaxID=1836956 RepID=A0AAD9A7W8_9PEZI|nr:hypothetical protein CCHR01_15328 [Colletotrichum chrysophilum]
MTVPKSDHPATQGSAPRAAQGQGWRSPTTALCGVSSAGIRPTDAYPSTLGGQIRVHVEMVSATHTVRNSSEHSHHHH